MTYIESHWDTLLLGGALVLLIAYWLSNRRQGHGKFPPGPRGWPILGNILDMKKWDVKGPGILDKWARQYGDIYGVQLGSYPTVILNSVETIKEAFLKHPDTTSGRGTNIVFFKRVLGITNVGVALNDGQKWKDLRRTMLHSLRDFGMGKKSLEHRIQEEARALVNHLDSFSGAPFDPRVMLHNAFSNVIVSIAFGERYEYDDPEFKRLANLLGSLFKGGGFKNPEMFTTILIPLLPFTNKDLFKAIKANKSLHDALRTTIKNHKDRFDPTEIRSFIDIYLKAEQDGEIENADSERQMFFTILDLFFAGSETSTTTTRWAILYLIHNPDVQAKCQQVIKQVIGQEKIPSGADRANLVYIEATILEIQRVANIAPYGVIHRAEATLELSGYTIPKDTLIIPNIYHVHMDSRYWDKPEQFNPDRWIGADGHLVKHEAFMPFSVGPRECPGKSLALQEMFIIIVSLLQKFTFNAKDPNNLPKLKGEIGIVYGPDDYEIVLTRW